MATTDQQSIFGQATGGSIADGTLLGGQGGTFADQPPTAQASPALDLAPSQSTTGGASGTGQSYYTPTVGAFDESKGVAGRTAALIAQDSPIMQQARTQAAQAANRRGLLSSSIAAGAGEAAVLDRAVPIANADANLFGQQRLANQNAINSAGQFNANLGAGQRNAEAQLGENRRQFDATQGQNLAMFKDELAQRQTLATLDADTRQKIAQLQATSQKDSSINSAWGQMMANIQAIQTNKDLTGETKQEMIQGNLAAFSSFAQFWSDSVKNGGGDVSALLDFGIVGAPAGGSGGSATSLAGGASNVSPPPPAPAPPPQNNGDGDVNDGSW